MFGKVDKIQYSMAGESEKSAPPDLFEDSIAKVGFGLYNVYIMLTTLPGAMAVIFSSSALSYVMPRAECDLQLGIKEKCFLNAITYAGMIAGSVPWALFSDRTGRRKVVVIAHFLDSFFNFMCSISQNFVSLLVFKFGSGVCISGAYSALMTYVAETHGTKYRPYVILTVGFMLTVSSLTLPFIAMGVLSQHWKFRYMGFMYGPYHLFLAICATPSFVCGVMYLFMPETVKYQMSKGRNAAALETLKAMYARNTRKPLEEFPIESLGPEAQRPSHIDSGKVIVQEVWKLILEIFSPPYVYTALCIFAVGFVVLCSQNTLRLWLPQVFASMAEQNKNSNFTVCSLFKRSIQQTAILHNKPEDCHIVISASSYLNNVYVNCVSLVAYVFALIIVKYLNAKVVLSLSLFLASLIVFASCYIVNSEFMVVATISAFLAMENVCSTVMVVVCASLFPTHMRNTLISMTMTVGRIGSLVGNLLVYTLIYMNCFYAVMSFGGFGTFGFVMSLLIPILPDNLP